MYRLISWMAYKMEALSIKLFDIVDKHDLKEIGKAYRNGDIEIKDDTFYFLDYCLKIFYDVIDTKDYNEHYDQRILNTMYSLETEDIKEACSYIITGIVNLTRCDEELTNRAKKVFERFEEKYNLTEEQI